MQFDDELLDTLCQISVPTDIRIVEPFRETGEEVIGAPACQFQTAGCCPADKSVQTTAPGMRIGRWIKRVVRTAISSSSRERDGNVIPSIVERKRRTDIRRSDDTLLESARTGIEPAALAVAPKCVHKCRVVEVLKVESFHSTHILIANRPSKAKVQISSQPETLISRKRETEVGIDRSFDSRCLGIDRNAEAYYTYI